MAILSRPQCVKDTTSAAIPILFLDTDFLNAIYGWCTNIIVGNMFELLIEFMLQYSKERVNNYHTCGDRHSIMYSWIILCMGPANKSQRYNVTSALIGWAHTQNDPWVLSRCSCPVQDVVDDEGWDVKMIRRRVPCAGSGVNSLRLV